MDAINTVTDAAEDPATDTVMGATACKSARYPNLPGMGQDESQV